MGFLGAAGGGGGQQPPHRQPGGAVGAAPQPPPHRVPPAARPARLRSGLGRGVFGGLLWVWGLSFIWIGGGFPGFPESFPCGFGSSVRFGPGGFGVPFGMGFGIRESPLESVFGVPWSPMIGFGDYGVPFGVSFRVSGSHFCRFWGSLVFRHRFWGPWGGFWGPGVSLQVVFWGLMYSGVSFGLSFRVPGSYFGGFWGPGVTLPLVLRL